MKSKMKNKMGNRARPRRDLLSDLPLSIIHTILSLLPFKQAVRTSLLSKQWRFTWVSLPYLKFDDDDRLPRQTTSEFAESENKVISHALRRHEGPVLRFEISFLEDLELPKLNEWILFLSKNDIRELVIDGSEFEMDDSIYKCSKLTHLELYNATFGPPPPTFNGFPFLRSLSLFSCDLSEEIETLLVKSPLLERLTLKFTPDSSKLKINHPYLKYLSLGGLWDEIHLCAPLLTELHAQMFEDCAYLSNHIPPRHPPCNYINSLGGLNNLEKIYVEESFMKTLSIGMESCHCTLVFPHLKEIVLHGVHFEDTKETSVVASLIIAAPNLQKLSLSDIRTISREKEYESKSPNVSFEDFGFPPNLKFKKLRVVTMYRICSYDFGLQLIKFLLGSSPELETMNLRKITDKGYKKVTAKLLAFQRAYPNVQILLD